MLHCCISCCLQSSIGKGIRPVLPNWGSSLWVLQICHLHDSHLERFSFQGECYGCGKEKVLLCCFIGVLSFCLQFGPLVLLPIGVSSFCLQFVVLSFCLQFVLTKQSGSVLSVCHAASLNFCHLRNTSSFEAAIVKSRCVTALQMGLFASHTHSTEVQNV